MIGYYTTIHYELLITKESSIAKGKLDLTHNKEFKSYFLSLTRAVRVLHQVNFSQKAKMIIFNIINIINLPIIFIDSEY